VEKIREVGDGHDPARDLLEGPAVGSALRELEDVARGAGLLAAAVYKEPRRPDSFLRAPVSKWAYRHFLAFGFDADCRLAGQA
jgi:hypothetical protein